MLKTSIYFALCNSPGFYEVAVNYLSKLTMCFMSSILPGTAAFKQ